MMKKLLLACVLFGVGMVPTYAQQKAIYVKKGESVTKYNFGVAGDLNFSNGGKTLTVSGYQEAIDLTQVDYITFSPSIDETALTPSAQKEKLLAIGEEVNKRVDMNKNADVILLFDAFFRYRGDKSINEYYLDRKYWDVHGAVTKMTRAGSEITKGNASAVAALRSAAVELYKLSDYFGVFTANTSTLSWDKTADAQYIEMRFPGFANEIYAVRLEGNGTPQNWSTPEANIELPAAMTLTLFKNDVKIAQTVITTTLVQDQSIDMKTVFDSGSYVVESNFSVRNEGITELIAVSFNGERFCTINNRIDGKNLLDYDEMYDAVKGALHSHDESGNCMDDGDFSKLFAHLFRASSDIDILGQLQLKGKAFNFGKLDEALGEDDWLEGNVVIDGKSVWSMGKVSEWNPNTGTMRISSDVPSVIDNKVRYLNNYVDAPFFYDGKSSMQGYISWGSTREDEERWMAQDNDYMKFGYIIIDGMLVQVTKEFSTNWVDDKEVAVWSDWHYDVYDENGEYSSVIVEDKDVIHPSAIIDEYYGFNPVIVFPDLTTYSMGEYFTETAFKSLVDDINDIIDTYFTITGQDRNNDN